MGRIRAGGRVFVRGLMISVALVTAACSTVVVEDAGLVSTTVAATVAMTQPVSVSSTVAATTQPVPPGTSSTSSTVDEGTWYLASVTASLPQGFSDGLATLQGVEVVSTVRVGLVHLVESRRADGRIVDVAPDGFFIPLEAQAFEPMAHGAFVPSQVSALLQSLDDDEVLLSESSAVFRGLGVDSVLVVEDGSVLHVTGVVPDEWVGSAELVVTYPRGERLGVTTERYSLVRYGGFIEDLARDADALVDASVRVRSRDQVDVFRHADAVASQIAVKTRFGEFSYRPVDGDVIELDPAWVANHIVRQTIPLLGPVTCHAEFAAMLQRAMTVLQTERHADAIDPAAFRGCYKPRLIRSRYDLSRHAWGVAADINFGNPTGTQPGSPTNPALLEATAATDIRSGHAWTDPGPGHFEWFPPDGN